MVMFMCQHKKTDIQNGEQGQVYLRAVTNGNEEAKKYFSYTPYGELTLGILNKATFDQFNQGKTHKITLEQID